jgi:hypothetical protein
MKVFCLGGAGTIAREAVLDLVSNQALNKSLFQTSMKKRAKSCRMVE